MTTTRPPPVDLKDGVEITTQEEADAFFERYLAWILADRKEPTTREEAEVIARQNLGYFSGYYGVETQRRVEQLYRTCHPLFGPVDTAPPKTPDQVMEIGKQLAEQPDLFKRSDLLARAHGVLIAQEVAPNLCREIEVALGWRTE